MAFLFVSLLMNFVKNRPMLAAVEFFAGCSPLPKLLVSHRNQLYYIAHSNLIEVSHQHANPVLQLDSPARCISASDSLICIGDLDGNAYVIENNQIILKYPLNYTIHTCCTYNNGISIFATLDLVLIIVKNELQKFEQKLLKINEGIITAVEILENKIIIGMSDGKIDIYTLDGLCYLASMNAHEQNIRDIKAGPTNIVASASQDSTIKLWELNDSLVHLQTLDGHTDWVHSLLWNGNELYSASADKTIRIWEQNKENKLYRSKEILGSSCELMGMAFVDGLLVQCKTGGIDKYKLIGKDIGEKEYYISGHVSEVVGLDWKDGMILTGDKEGTARVFYRGKERGRPQIHGFGLASVAWLPGERIRYVSAAQETILRIYEGTQLFIRNLTSDSNKILKEKYICGTYVETAILSELNLTNENVNEHNYTAHSEDSLSRNVFAEIKKIYGHFFDLKCVETSEELILSCNRSSTRKHSKLFVWDLEGRFVQSIAAHDLGIQDISASGKTVLTVSRDKTACIFRISSGKLIVCKRLADHSRALISGSVSHSTNVFATSGRDCKVVLYSLDSLLPIADCSFQEEPTALALSPADSILVIGFASGVVKVTDLKLKILHSDKLANGRINKIKFNSDGRLIAVVSADTSVRTFRVNGVGTEAHKQLSKQ